MISTKTRQSDNGASCRLDDHQPIRRWRGKVGELVSQRDRIRNEIADLRNPPSDAIASPKIDRINALIADLERKRVALKGELHGFGVFNEHSRMWYRRDDPKLAVKIQNCQARLDSMEKELEQHRAELHEAEIYLTGKLKCFSIELGSRRVSDERHFRHS